MLERTFIYKYKHLGFREEEKKEEQPQTTIKKKKVNSILILLICKQHEKEHIFKRAV